MVCGRQILTPLTCERATACTVRHLNVRKWSQTVSFYNFWLANVLRATTACAFLTSQVPKVVRDPPFLTLRPQGPKVVRDCQLLQLLTYERASRHNGLRFFDISTPKNCLRPSVFNTFDLRHSGVRFRHLNCQKWSKTISFYHFWLANVLRATPACNFWHLNCQKLPETGSFNAFDLRMCFTPHWRALFEYLDIQKWSETICLTLLTCECASLRTTTAPTFWVSQLLSALTFKCF